jgi:hypothetical protein
MFANRKWKTDSFVTLSSLCDQMQIELRTGGCVGLCLRLSELFRDRVSAVEVTADIKEDPRVLGLQ